MVQSCFFAGSSLSRFAQWVSVILDRAWSSSHLRKGFIGYQTVAFLHRKVQRISVTQTPLQERNIDGRMSKRNISWDTLCIIVIGHKNEQFKELLGDNYRYVEQKELLGTGHAVSQADSLLSGQSDLVLVVPGDMPLVKTQTLKRLM